MGIVACRQAIVCTDEGQFDLVIVLNVLAVVDDDIIADLDRDIQVSSGP